MLVAKKPKAIGTPAAMRASSMPIITVTTQYHSMAV